VPLLTRSRTVAWDNGQVTEPLADDLLVLRHVIVVGGTSQEWAARSAEQWAQFVGDLGKVADHAGVSCLVVRPYGPGAATVTLDAVAGQCRIAVRPQADGRARLAAATAALQAAGDAIDEQTLDRVLHAPADTAPDLVVVVGSGHRLPPSLVWELAYSELVFVEVPFASFAPEHLEEAIASFARRHRRFGGVD
jgi:undecaprenyl diphosphate synthase